MIRVIFLLLAVAICGAFSESTGPCAAHMCPRGMVCIVKEHQCPFSDCPEYASCKDDPDFDACANFNCPDGTTCVANGRFARCQRDADTTYGVASPRDVCENFRCYMPGNVCVARQSRCPTPYGWRNCTLPSCVPDPATPTATVPTARDACTAHMCPRGMVCIVKEHQCPFSDCPEYASCKDDPDFDACANFNCPDGTTCVSNGRFARCERDADTTHGVASPRDVCENFRCYMPGNVCVARQSRCPTPYGWRNCTLPSCVPDPATPTATVPTARDACTNYGCPYGTECELVDIMCFAAPCPQFARCVKPGDCPARPDRCFNGRNRCGDDVDCPESLKCCHDGCVRRCAMEQNDDESIGK